MKKGKTAPQLHLRITEQCINDGTRKNASACAAAQAVLKICPQATYIHCDVKEVSFTDPIRRVRRRYFNTAAGAKFIVAFDRGKKLKPTTLHLNDGIEVPMGWRAKHPGSTRKGKIYKRTGKKARVRYTKYRHFGACNIAESEAEVYGG